MLRTSKYLKVSIRFYESGLQMGSLIKLKSRITLSILAKNFLTNKKN